MISINLTSLPERQRFLPSILSNFLNQQCSQQFSVNLWLPKQSLRGPSWDSGYSPNIPGVNTYWVDDIGPLTKLWYALEEASSDDLIVTADDDVTYPQYWLQNLYDWHTQLNGVICNRGRILRNLIYNDSIRLRGYDIRGPQRCHITTGTWGQIIPKRWISDDFFEVELDQDHLMNDDLYLSGYLWNKNTPIWIVPCGHIEPIRDAAFSPNALFNQNHHGPVNDRLIGKYFSECQFD